MDFIGNKKHREYFTQILTENVQRTHAHLFVGPSEIGKQTLARTYARAVIMGSTELSFDDTQHASYDGDLFLCAPERKKDTHAASITIDQLRTHLTALTRSPYHGHKRVLIIDDAHLMTTSAQNALLKTLEEPIATSLLILVTAQPSALLPTLHSRCMTTTFVLPSQSDMSALGLSEEIASLSFNRPGRAHRLRHDEVFYAQQQELLQTVEDIAALSIQQRLQLAQELSTDRSQTTDFLTTLLHMMHARARTEQNYSLFLSLEKIQIAQKLLTQNVNARLTLENLLIAL